MIDSIFQPHFDQASETITHAIDDIERQQWLFERMLLMPKHHAWIRREVLIRRASGTTRIENVGMEESAVAQLVRSDAGNRPDEAEQANLNAVRAYEFIDYVSDQTDIPIDEFVVRHLNREFMYGSSEGLTPGVYRKGQNEVPGFLTPNQGDVPALMREFGLWLGSEDSLHPIIKAGLTHIHLVAIHPFWDGNGRTARGLTTLMLQRGGYGFKQLLALENGFANIRDQYFTAVERALGATFEREYDASTWLEFFTSCLLAEALRLTGELTDWHRMMEEWHEKADALGLNFRQVDGLAYAIQMNRITRGDYMEITNASPATASRDLAELVNWGILAAEGRTRSRVYVLQHPSDAKQRSDGGSQQPPAI